MSVVKLAATRVFVSWFGPCGIGDRVERSTIGACASFVGRALHAVRQDQRPEGCPRQSSGPESPQRSASRTRVPEMHPSHFQQGNLPADLQNSGSAAYLLFSSQAQLGVINAQ